MRDDRERDLGLPEGPPYELPLLLADRNFDTAPRGGLTGDLLHKTDPDVMECFGPFTVVNGAIWPRIEVEPATYRFRVLNGSNARTYRLVLTRDGEPDHARITQIGTEGGLLLGPVPIPAHGLVLASAERADLLVDFSDLAPRTRCSPSGTSRQRRRRRRRRQPRPTARSTSKVTAQQEGPDRQRGALPRVAWRRPGDGLSTLDPRERSTGGAIAWRNRRPRSMVRRPC